MISSLRGRKRRFERQMLTWRVGSGITPQGTLAEKCRAGGAYSCIFYSAGYGIRSSRRTERESMTVKMYILEESLSKADFAIVKAWKGDTKEI